MNILTEQEFKDRLGIGNNLNTADKLRNIAKTKPSNIAKIVSNVDTPNVKALFEAFFMGYESSIMWGTKFGNKIMFKVYGKTDNQVAEIDLWISDSDMNLLSSVSSYKDAKEPFLIGYTDTENFIVVPNDMVALSLLKKYQEAEKEVEIAKKNYEDFVKRIWVKGDES